MHKKTYENSILTNTVTYIHLTAKKKLTIKKIGD